MQNSKIDKRVQYTKKLIRDTLFDMLECMPIERISVKSLCDRGDINRGTFYSHYADIYALMEEIEAEYADQLNIIVSEMYRGSDYMERVADQICRFFRDNPSMCTIIFNKRASREFMDDIAQKCKMLFAESWKNRGSIDNELSEYIFSYTASGSLAILEQWYRGQFITPIETVKQILINLTFYGLSIYAPKEP